MYTTFRQLKGIQTEKLLEIYPFEEAQEMVLRLLEHFSNLSRTELLLKYDSMTSDDLEENVTNSVERLLKKEPLQYIIGEVEFYDGIFKVTPDVLIPRPETEELVDIVVRDWTDREFSLIDFGTGTGCIPISIKKVLPLSHVSSVDISEKAILLAKENARNNHVEVEFINADMRTFVPVGEYDVIVSNPPYVLNSEKNLMRENVLKFEPHLALFVKDDRPLEFYEAIAGIAARSLKKSGKIYLEINQQLGMETSRLLEQYGFDAEVRKDFFGVDRFIIAQWKKEKGGCR